jgi:3-hydroxybutyrate dehydrogenase
MNARRILITGAGSGIGAGLARHLSHAGHDVAVTDAKQGAADRLAGELRGNGSRVAAFELDVTDPTGIEQVLSKLEQPVEVLINNAGLQNVGKLEDQLPESWSLLIDVMLKGAAYATRAVLPGMKKANYGRIVNIGSIHSIVASPFKSAYVAAKHGLVGFSKAVAIETATHDITINTICPAYVRTPLVDAQIESQAREHGITAQQVIHDIMLAPMPKRRFISIEEIAASVDFLLSDAARNITGQCLVIDGGWTAQ